MITSSTGPIQTRAAWRRATRRGLVALLSLATAAAVLAGAVGPAAGASPFAASRAIVAPRPAAAVGPLGTGSPDGQGDRSTSDAADRIVLTLAPGRSIGDAARDLAGRGIPITASLDQIGTLVVDAGSPAGRAATLALLASDPTFASAGAPMPMWADGIPNDPMLSTEWWLDAIDVKPAWDWPSPPSPVVIATIDTGVDFANPDLAGVLLEGRNFVTPDTRPQDDSENGHGTHVAGIAAARVNDGVGMAGVAPWARILPVKVLDATGQAESTLVAAGIIWAADQGARVVNLSLDGAAADPCPTELVRAIDYARSKDAVVVSASGNLGSAVGCPGRIPGVLSVGAVDAASRVWPSSNRGPQLSLVAPGVGINSTIPVGMGGHGTLTGTSMAAPMVSGAAAILAGAAPSLGEAAIRAALTGTAKDLGLPGRDDTYGAGIVDVGAALRTAAEPITHVTATPAVLVADGSGAADIAAISFHVSVPATVTVAVERTDGTVVRSLSTDPLTPGDERFEWNGADDAGVPVPDGSYRFAIRGTGPGGIAVDIVRPIGVSLALASARLSPTAISPNADGRADRTAATFTLRGPATVAVTVRDAAGRTLRTLATGPRAAGIASVAWDGRIDVGATSAVAGDGPYIVAVAATTARGTYMIALPIAVSVHGVAVASLRATPVYPVSDGYRDLSAVTFTQAGAATSAVYVYGSTSASPIRVITNGRQPAGSVRAAWDGRDAAGRTVRAGTYRVRIRTVDAGLVARWSTFAPVVVSAKRLVARTFTLTLRGDQHAPQTFVSSQDAASVAASTVLVGGVRLAATGPDDRATAFWEVGLPAHVGLTSATLRVTAERDGRGDTLVGTWNGTTVDDIGFIQAAAGTTTLAFPAATIARWGPRIALAVNQDGPGAVDVGSLTFVLGYTILR